MFRSTGREVQIRAVGRFLLILAVGLVLGGTSAIATSQASAAEEEEKKGCWYTPPDPPACDICGWSCGVGQKCCEIVVQD